MSSLIEAHEANTEAKVDTIVADSKYGTKENFLGCKDKGINAHMPVLKAQCTKSKTVRTVQRHLRQEELNMMFTATQTSQAKRDIKTCQHLMERSFVRSVRFGFDRARWRGLWNLNIQEFLVSNKRLFCNLLRFENADDRYGSVSVMILC